LASQFVLGRRRHGHIARQLPDGAAGHVMAAAPLQAGIFRDALAAHLLDLLHQVEVDSLFVDHIAVAVGTGDDLAAKGPELLHGIDGDVARARHHAALALQRAASGLQHALHEIDGAIARRLPTRAGAAIGQPFACQDAGFIAVGQPLVLSEEIADLAAANSDITRGDVGILSQMPPELGHEGLTEAHDFRLGAAARIEIRPALAAADGHPGQRILEGLLEAQKLDDAEIDGGMEPQAALVRAQRRIELNAKTAVDLHLALIIHPGNTKDDLPLWLADTLDQTVIGIFGMLGNDASEALENLAHGL